MIKQKGKLRNSQPEILLDCFYQQDPQAGSSLLSGSCSPFSVIKVKEEVHSRSVDFKPLVARVEVSRVLSGSPIWAQNSVFSRNHNLKLEEKKKGGGSTNITKHHVLKHRRSIPINRFPPNLVCGINQHLVRLKYKLAFALNTKLQTNVII